MSSPSFLWLPSRGAYVQAQADDAAGRDQQYENSARVAFQHLTYTSTGTGQIIVPNPLRFDTTFGEPPVVVTGSVLVTPPGDGWAYPQVTAGVYRWLTDAKGYVTGAYVYFNVRVDPVNPDDDAVARLVPQSLQDQLDHLQNGTWAMDMRTTKWRQAEIARIKAEIRRAQRALTRKGTDGEVAIIHHLLFQGVAMKDLPDFVTSEISTW